MEIVAPTASWSQPFVLHRIPYAYTFSQACYKLKLQFTILNCSPSFG